MRIRKSAVYERQLEGFAEDYRDRAGIEIAYNFLDGIDESVEFIGKMPKACMVAHDLKLVEGLEEYEFRRWKVRGFPHSIFFRITDDRTILLEAIYAQKMDITNRLPSDIDVMGNR